MTKKTKVVRKTLAFLLACASTLSHAYPACFLTGATTLVPLGTTYNVGPNLAAAINAYTGLGQALLDGINVWKHFMVQLAFRRQAMVSRGPYQMIRTT